MSTEKRNQQIYQSYLLGRSLTYLAQHHDLTPESIRLIIRKAQREEAKRALADQLKETPVAEHPLNVLQISEALLQDLNRHGYHTIGDILQLPQSHLFRLPSFQQQKFRKLVQALRIHGADLSNWNPSDLNQKTMALEEKYLDQPVPKLGSFPLL